MKTKTRSATVIALIALVAPAQANGLASKDLMSNLVDKLVDRSPLLLKDLDSTMLGKPSHLAVPNSHLSSRSVFHSLSFPTPGLASPAVVQGRFRQDSVRAAGSRELLDKVVSGLEEEDASMPMDKDSELRMAITHVAREQRLPVPEVQQKFAWLKEVLALDVLEMEGVNLTDVIRLAVHAPVDKAEFLLRVLKLKVIMPATDVGKLVARCPRLMDAETDLDEVKAELDAAVARMDAEATDLQRKEGVPRKELGDLMAELLPQVFLQGKPAWIGSSESPKGELVWACCNEARRLFSCKTNLEAVQRMLKWEHTKVVMRNLEKTKHLVASH